MHVPKRYVHSVVDSVMLNDCYYNLQYLPIHLLLYDVHDWVNLKPKRPCLIHQKSTLMATKHEMCSIRSEFNGTNLPK